MNSVKFIGVLALLMFMLSLLPGASGQGKILNKIFYVDARTWPSQPDMLKHLSRGKFYIPVQDDGLVAVIDPEKPGYLVKLIKFNAAQPYHPWIAPGMRYVYINHQSEGKGDHNVMTVIDSFTDEVVAEIKTGMQVLWALLAAGYNLFQLFLARRIRRRGPREQTDRGVAERLRAELLLGKGPLGLYLVPDTS